ncbi:MAG: hypothetical protein M3Q69_13775 [Acidobacteriota bacterium]|nr:hypothetical protein [Acidobacteriota bacterium]
MRYRNALFAVLAFAVFNFHVVAIGQEQPLPPVTPRADAPSEVMLVALETEPIHTTSEPSLAEAARANDYASFEAIYNESKQRGAIVSQYEAFHELWTYSINDPIGAFYGQEMYERISRAYPGFASYIDDYRIVDNRGNVFYPTSETRDFLLARAIEGRTAPRVLIAQTNEAETPREIAREVKPAAVKAKAPVAAKAPIAKVARSKPAPVVIEPPQVVAPAPVAQTAVVEQPAPIATPAPQAQAVAAAPVVAAAMVPGTDTAKPTDSASRGILLIILGIIGFGMLAVMLRAPKEIAPQTIDVKATPSTADAKDAAPVEPLRRPEAPQKPAAKHRANGSRG